MRLRASRGNRCVHGALAAMSDQRREKSRARRARRWRAGRGRMEGAVKTLARMTKRERVLAALDRRPVDRPPVAFWRHAPDVDHTAKGLADAMLAFHRRFDLDLIKLMSSGVYCVEDWGCQVDYDGAINGAKRCTRHAVQSRDDWARITTLDVG